jgi:exonuclease VII large subunit
MLLLFVGAASPGPLLAEEPASIRHVLDEPRTYHLRHVTLHGTVRNVTPLDPYKLPNETVCYGAYLFSLEDEDAAIPVAVLGFCGKPMVRDPDVEDGDHVEVSATIQAPGHNGYYLSFRGLKVATDQEGIVQAVADRILPIVE